MRARKCSSSMICWTSRGSFPASSRSVRSPFRWSGSSTQRRKRSGYRLRHEGLGLGLAIVRHLCEAHGGTVTAASEGAGRGAAFTVRLPIESVVARQAYVPSSPIMDEQVLARCHVLVVDDKADARFLASRMLTAAGAEVTAVGSAGEALHALQTQRFDAMVADIGMPKEDGYT